MTTITTDRGTARQLVASRTALGRLATGALLATGLAATMVLGTCWTATAMQTGLADAARTTLDAKNLAATVMVSGRDAYVWAKTPTERADAIAALRTVPGVRIVLVGEGEPPSRGAVVATQPDPHTGGSAPGSPSISPASSPTKATSTRPASTPEVRTSTTHKPSTMTKEG